MKQSRFTETQIVSILKEADAGRSVKELCRTHGISEATFCNWKSKYGGMSASELHRLREMEAELAQALIEQAALPARAAADALHIAIAVVNGIDYPSHVELYPYCQCSVAESHRNGLPQQRL